MNLNRFTLSACFISIFFFACSNDETPVEIVEEEVITTMNVTLAPQGGGTNITLSSQDLDGDGPNAPTVTVSGNLAANTTYDGSIVLLNETETPAENITTEVEAEDDLHQFFFGVSGALEATTDYSNFDGNGNPLGTEFSLTTGTASSGNLTITLRHEPKKPNDGTLGDAGGETDIAQTFNLTIE